MVAVTQGLCCRDEVADIKTFGGALGMMGVGGIPQLFPRSIIVLEKKIPLELGKQ